MASKRCDSFLHRLLGFLKNKKVMRQSRKETAWKKNRKFGDVKGGRMRPKLADNIFNRQHNLVA